ncbi:MAG: hypothetical protein Q9159_000607 [Coniocarpon cinnabarinum]
MDSDTSSLSDVPPSEDEKPQPPAKPVLKLVNGRLGGFARKKPSPESSPEPDQADLGREPSPPHEYVLADNPDIAVSLSARYARNDAFRSRFDAALPKSVTNLGPQDVENGVVSSEPSEVVENLLCALLGLALNRKKTPERGHYARALEECLSTFKNQWPRSWAGVNPISGGKTFQAFTPSEKLNLLRTLIHWSLGSSESVNAIIKESYKQARKDDDINQPLSVQPWGMDTRKRKFYLVEGQVDAPFRIYRESHRKASTYTWLSAAGTIEEAQKIARDLRAEKGQAAHRLAARIINAVPILEEREEKRRRREYRKAQKERFVRPEPGFSLYEGRTRGKRMRYTYDDDDDAIYGTDENRRSSRDSRTGTPSEGPTFTTSGRQVRSAYGRSYGDRPRRGIDSSTRESSQSQDQEYLTNGRSHRAARQVVDSSHRPNHSAMQNHIDDFDDESDAESTGEEWGGDDQDFEGKLDEEDADESSDAGLSDDIGANENPRSLIVKLPCGPKLVQMLGHGGHSLSNTQPVTNSDQFLPVSSKTDGIVSSTAKTEIHQNPTSPKQEPEDVRDLQDAHVSNEQHPAGTPKPGSTQGNEEHYPALPYHSSGLVAGDSTMKDYAGSRPPTAQGDGFHATNDTQSSPAFAGQPGDQPEIPFKHEAMQQHSIPAQQQ